MKPFIFTTLLVLVLFVNTFSAQTTADKQLAAKCDQLLSEQFKASETGGTALIAKKGQIIYKKAFGMADLELNIPMQADNVFRIGSISKQFTAVAILQLMEQGKLGLQRYHQVYIRLSYPWTQDYYRASPDPYIRNSELYRYEGF